jgi:putative intracellular protease/amidase
MSTQTQQRIVHVAVYPGWADWEAGYLISRINSPMWQAEPGSFTVRTVAETLELVPTMGGLRIAPDITFADLRPADSAMLVLPGADSWDQDPGANPHAVAAAREFLASGVPVAAICGATAGLARAGLLDDRQHTSSAAEYLLYGTGYAGGALYRDEPAVYDRGLITAGPLHPAEFARTALETLRVFHPPVLDAWYRMFGKHDASAFAELAGQGARA